MLDRQERQGPDLGKDPRAPRPGCPQRPSPWIALVGVALVTVLASGSAQAGLSPGSDETEELLEKQTELIVSRTYERLTRLSVGSAQPIEVEAFSFEHTSFPRAAAVRFDELIDTDVDIALVPSISTLKDGWGRRVAVVQFQEVPPEQLPGLQLTIQEALQTEGLGGESADEIRLASRYSVKMIVGTQVHTYTAAAIWRTKDSTEEDQDYEVYLIDPAIPGLAQLSRLSLPSLDSTDPMIGGSTAIEPPYLEDSVEGGSTGQLRTCQAREVSRFHAQDLGSIGTEDHIAGSHGTRGTARVSCSCDTSCFSTAETFHEGFQAYENSFNLPLRFHIVSENAVDTTRSNFDGDVRPAQGIIAAGAGAIRCLTAFCSGFSVGVSIDNLGGVSLSFSDDADPFWQRTFEGVRDCFPCESSGPSDLSGRLQMAPLSDIGCSATVTAEVEGLASGARLYGSATDTESEFTFSGSGSLPNGETFRVTTEQFPPVDCLPGVTPPALECRVHTPSGLGQIVNGRPIPGIVVRCQCSGGNLESSGSCETDCLFCAVPDLDDRCMLAPESCATQPSGGICEYHLTFDRVPDSSHLLTFSHGWIKCRANRLDLDGSEESTADLFGPDNGSEEWTQDSFEIPPFQAPWQAEAPILYVRNPVPDGIVPSNLVVDGVARDDRWGVDEILFWIDGQSVEPSSLQMNAPDYETCLELPAAACDSNSAFHASFPTLDLSRGRHTLEIVAMSDRPGLRIPTYGKVEFIYGQACTDHLPPAIGLLQPLPGATVSGLVSLEAEAVDERGVDFVDFYVDGAWRATVHEQPWTWNWDSRLEESGPHTLRALAVDHCGNRRFSAPAGVEVSNSSTRVVLTPIADAWSNQTSPNENFGHYNFLRVRTIDGGVGRHAYMKFSVPDLPGPILSATLRLRTQDQDVERFGMWTMVDNTWQEGTLTWNNAPLDHTGPVPGAQDLLLEANQWHEIDVTSVLPDGNRLITFGMASGRDQGERDLWSRESAFPPELVLVVGAAP